MDGDSVEDFLQFTNSLLDEYGQNLLKQCYYQAN